VKILVVVGGVLLVIGLAGVIAYRLFLPRAFVTYRRGSMTEAGTLTVSRVTIADETLNYNAKTVRAGDGHKYVLVDCRIAAPASSIDFDDFQLVRGRAAKLGEEVNVGDNADSDHFYWMFLDASGAPAPEVAGSTNPVNARLSFKVPAETGESYLFYWGLYWGPFSLRGAGR